MGITMLIVMSDIFLIAYVTNNINIFCSIYLFSVLYFAKYIYLSYVKCCVIIWLYLIKLTICMFLFRISNINFFNFGCNRSEVKVGSSDICISANS